MTIYKSRFTIYKALALAFILATGLYIAAARVVGAADDVAGRVDRIFDNWTATTPGCAVGASVAGKPVLTSAYGLADLEHNVKNTPDTIFEAGSVSKQFTAASVLLLAREGKLSLDDPVRKYIPELPDYGSPLTIRHILTHTSGLRDWGSVEAIAGWPRTSRAYTHAHVLEIVARQHALNFTPGTRWSYSNTGFNLAAMIVSRVSGQTFTDFTRTHLFEPLGMDHTSWRDDYTRVVRNRALAYVEQRDGYHTDMPFENVFGNGGLLTTVGDLLKWNENFVSPRIADADFVALQQKVGTFSDGRAHGYAFGLRLTTVNGVRVVEHSGSTAGYSAHLLRLPDQRISVAVLCNAAGARATDYAHKVADLLLPNHADTAPASGRPLPVEAGMLYRNVDNGLVLLTVPAGSTWTVQSDHRLRVTDRYGVDEIFDSVPQVAPSMTDLREFAGRYTSEEAETTLATAVEGRSLVVKRRPATTIPLTPLYRDAFDAPRLGVIIFRRDASGHVNGLSVIQDRVWDLRFKTAATAHPRARRGPHNS